MASVRTLESLVVTLAKNTYNKNLAEFNGVKEPKSEKIVAGTTLRNFLKVGSRLFSQIYELAGWITELSINLLK
jgi:hypothetical protein